MSYCEDEIVSESERVQNLMCRYVDKTKALRELLTRTQTTAASPDAALLNPKKSRWPS